MTRLLLIGALGLGLVSLVGCGDPVGTQASDPPAPTPTVAEPAPAATAPKPAQPSGPPVTVAPAKDQDGPAAVNKVQALTGDNAKIYSVAGGDPAVNGTMTYLALFGGPAQGWKVFQIGDFADWDVVEQAKGRVVLKVSRSAVNQASGKIVTGEALMIVSVPAFSADEITVTPAS